MAIIMYKLVPAAFVPGLGVVSGESFIGASEMIQFIDRCPYILDYHIYKIFDWDLWFLDELINYLAAKLQYLLE